MAMTPKERVLATVNDLKPDKIAVHHCSVSGYAARVILGRPALVGGAYVQWREMHAMWEGPDAHAAFDAQCEKDAVAVAKACGHDVLRLRYWRWPAREKPVRKIDDNTFVFGDPDGDWYKMVYHPELELLSREDSSGVAEGRSSPDETEWTEDSLRAHVEATEAGAEAFVPPPGPNPAMLAMNEQYPDYVVRTGGGSVLIKPDSVNQLMAAALWPDLMARLLMAQARRIAKTIPAMAEAGVAINFSGGDFCSKHGPVISPDTYRHLVMPALKVIVDACRASGMHYFYATDGDVWPVADAMFNGAGVDGFYEIDRRAGMDLRRLRREFPQVTLMGNVSVQTLHTGTEEDVVRETMSCLETAHDCGRIIVGASNLIMPGTPPENIEAMLKSIEANR